mmetsp:Transcript_35834/g.85428  ORF Transcript_35834/g.85428 Transcript_35834/m.85428 type:complete len:557 (+) Transcript_35834:266-1936(+)
MIASINQKVDASFVGRFFKFEERGTTFSTEWAGATATFLTMAYILAVNPRILADSGGPCVADPEDGGIFGEAYEECLEELTRQYVTATAIGSTFACLLMGILGNLPVALAPGMGMNAYFTYSVVGFRGTGNVSWQAATTAVMIEGAIFFILALTGLRYRLIKIIPEPVRIATPAGIGAFLAHLGLQTAEGLGVVVSDIATIVTLGGCPPENRTPIVAYDDDCMNNGICIPSDAYTCDNLGGKMTSARMWLGIVGMMIIAVASAYKSKMAFIYGIAFVTIISWFRNTAVTFFPDDPVGDFKFTYFSKVVDITGLDLLMVPFTSDLSNVALALITMLYVDFLDTSGTLLGLADTMGIIDEDGNFPGATRAFSVDACATMFGSLFGLSPITSYIESGAGVQVGAKTGMSAVICGFYFFVSIFFAPILASIPAWAVGGALIIVGSIMMKSLTRLKFERISHALSAFLTVMLMPLTYSIAYGLIAGIGSYIVMEGFFRFFLFFGIDLPGDEDGMSVNEETVKSEPDGVEPVDDKKGDIEEPKEQALNETVAETDHVEKVAD